jgi:hypothetical protein
LLDLSYPSPYYWTDEHAKRSKRLHLFPSWSGKHRKTFLDEDYCATDDEYFYVRGIIRLPIIGTDEYFCWGVWGSLSRENFEKLLAMEDDTARVVLDPMFSWLSSRLPDYPDTLHLKMYANVQERDKRPHFELEDSGHPLAQEYHNGISPERVKQIMLGHLRELR